MAVALSAASGNQEDVNGSGGDIVLAAPTSIASGDFRGHFCWDFGGSSAPAVGTGMTDLGSSFTSSYGVRGAYKIAGGSEGSITHTCAGSESASLGYAFRATGAHATTPLNASTAGHVALGTTGRPLPTITTTVDNCLIVYCVIIPDVAATPAVSSATTHDTFWNAGADLACIAYETKATAGTTTARTVTWSGGGSSTVDYVILAIAPAVTSQQVNAQVANLALSAVVGAVTGGAATKSAQVGALSLTAVAGTMTPGAATIVGQTATLVLGAQVGAITGAATINAQVALITLGASPGVVSGGVASISGQVATLILSAIPGSTSIGGSPQEITGQTATIALAAVAGAMVPGVATVGAQVATVTFVAMAGAVTGGATTVGAQTAILILTAELGTVTGGQVAVDAQTASLVMSAFQGALSGGPATQNGQVAILDLSAIAGTRSGGPATKSAQVAFLDLSAIAGVVSISSGARGVKVWNGSAWAEGALRAGPGWPIVSMEDV